MSTHSIKARGKIVILLVAVGLCLSASAQRSTFYFTTTLGSGSFTLDLNALTKTNSFGGQFTDSNSATYIDPSDVLTFNNTNYDSLRFTVVNDFYEFLSFGPYDGFIVEAGSNGTKNPPNLLIAAVGDSPIITGISPSDLLTVLSSYDQFFSVGKVYPSPHITYHPTATVVTNADLISFYLAPMLTIGVSGKQINLQWATNNASGFTLEQNSNLGTTNWVNYAGFVNQSDGTNAVTITTNAGSWFFRLHSP